MVRGIADLQYNLIDSFAKWMKLHYVYTCIDKLKNTCLMFIHRVKYVFGQIVMIFCTCLFFLTFAPNKHSYLDVAIPSVWWMKSCFENACYYSLGSFLEYNKSISNRDKYIAAIISKIWNLFLYWFKSVGASLSQRLWTLKK